MRLIAQHATQHTDACTAVGWSLGGELFSCGDDSTVRKWNMNGEALAKVCELDTCFTTIAFLPTSNSGQKRGTAAEVFVIGCTDGTFRFINAFTGRVEKTQEAHQGAVVSLAWNWDGTALVTGGEEGIVKLWSQSGMLRATLADSKHCVHGISWGPNNDQVLYTCGKELIIKPLQTNAKQLQWKAHEGIVLAVDWNPITNLVVSGGEDGRYKVWDSYGRVLYSSAPLDHPVTSTRFSPDGEMFAVGSYNVLRICDKSGWSHCRQETSFARGNGRAEHGMPVDDVVETGSILNIAWTSDCTQLACGGGTGTVCFAQLVDRRVEYKNLLVRLTDTTKVLVTNVETEAIEEIERPDKIIKMSIGYNYLIIATSTQCCIYNVQNFQNPIFLDVKDKINLICQTERVFLTMDHFSGIQVFGYDGHHVSTLKGASIRTEFLNYQSVSLSPDTVVLKDTHKQKEVQVFEALTGALNGHAQIQHPMEVVELALSQYGPQAERKLALVDRNRDLWLYSLRSKLAPVKLATMVASVKWNDQSEVLVAIADGKLAVWYCPSVVFVDRDLLPRVRVVREDTQFGRHDQLLDFCGSRCTVRRGADGACLTFAVRPYPIMLFGHTTKNDWNAAVRLCRFVKSDCLWSILAALSVKAGELATAEIAYAAINEADKLQYIKYIDEIGVAEARNAEVLLFQRRQDEAEKILLQANLIYRAIRMHIQLFNWDKALELAMKHRTHVDTVLWYRQKFLKNFNKVETDPKFLTPEILEVQIDPNAINAKRDQEKEREKQMAQTQRR